MHFIKVQINQHTTSCTFTEKKEFKQNAHSTHITRNAIEIRLKYKAIILHLLLRVTQTSSFIFPQTETWRTREKFAFRASCQRGLKKSGDEEWGAKKNIDGGSGGG